VQAAKEKEGKNGVVEVAMRYVTNYSPGMWKVAEQTRRAADALLRQRGTNPKDCHVDLCHQIVPYSE
jgi:hypothetical protein